MSDNISQNILQDKSLTKNNINLDYDLYIRSDNPDKAIRISKDNVMKIRLIENMFTILPTMNIVIQDNLRLFDVLKLKIGDPIYLKIKPVKSGEDDSIIHNFINTRMSIRKIDSMVNEQVGTGVYSLTCCYDAIKLISKTISYPEKTLLNVNLQETSDLVIKNILSKVGIPVVSEVTANDAMYWLNAKNKVKQFVEKVLSHAWIENDDFPIYFTDINGQGCYTSIKTICDKTTEANYSNPNNVMNNNLKDVFIYESFKQSEFSGISMLDDGYIQNAIVYDPMNRTGLLDLTEFVPNDQVDLLSTYQYGYRKSIYDSRDNKLSKISSKDDAFDESEISTKHFSGTHFIDTHQHYDVAPIHNKNAKRNFFQNSIELIIDLNKQDSKLLNSKKMPKLGTKIYVDFSGENRMNKIYSGEYIIAGITYQMIKDDSFMGKLTLVNDGYYGTGVIK